MYTIFMVKIIYNTAITVTIILIQTKQKVPLQSLQDSFSSSICDSLELHTCRIFYADHLQYQTYSHMPTNKRDRINHRHNSKNKL